MHERAANDVQDLLTTSAVPFETKNLHVDMDGVQMIGKMIRLTTE